MRKILSIFLVCTFVLSIFSITVHAATSKSYPYSNVGQIYRALFTRTRTGNTKETMKLNTRPQSGTSGANVWVAGSNSYSNIETFPYHTSRTPMTVSLKKNVSYTVSIAAVSGTVSGSLLREIE